MIVVDTSVVAHLFIPSDANRAAEKAMQKDADWIAPRLWRSELRNVLATRVRVRKMPIEHAVETITKAEELLRDREYEVSSAVVLSLSHRSGASAYDCEFVALAQQFGVPLVTTDGKLTSLFPEIAVSLQEWSGV